MSLPSIPIKFIVWVSLQHTTAADNKNGKHKTKVIEKLNKYSNTIKSFIIPQTQFL